MRLGLIARCDQRGIAHQTHEFARHMNPDATLMVMMGDPEWPETPQRFPGPLHVTGSNLSQTLTKRTLDEDVCRQFLDEVDVVFAVETVYDWEFITWAHEANVRVVIQGNPEFMAHKSNPTWSHPDLWVWPTTWMLDDMPSDVVLPVPTVERPCVAAPSDTEQLRVLHVVGKTAASDRNGTLDFLEAIRGLRHPTHITIVTQEPRLARNAKVGRNTTVEVVTGGMADRWDLYRDQHLLAFPRRYGGLCLPALEAMASGLAVIMTDCSPNETWPGPRLKARKGRIQRSPFGRIQTYGTHPIELTSMLDKFAQNREVLGREMILARRWAEQNTWDRLKPLYDETLSAVNS